MPAAWDAAVAFATVLLAELGDKTQLALLALAARGRPGPTFVGSAAAFAGLTVVAVVLGAWAADLVPARPAAVAAGLLLLGLGAWTLWSRARGPPGPGPVPVAQVGATPGLDAARGTSVGPVPPAPAGPAVPSSLRAAATAFGLVALAEVGDKSQLATASLAATAAAPWVAGLGSWAALCAAAGLACWAGSWVSSRLGARRMALVGGMVLVATGVAVLAARGLS